MESTIRTSTPSRQFSMFSNTVSFITSSLSECTPSRLQRSFSWETLSSAETYKTFFSSAKNPATSVSRVDLPIPGSPPSNTIDAGTMPPPSTLSSSALPERIRAKRSSFTSLSGRGRSKRAARSFACGRGSAISSTKLFHAPQFGHFPSHLGLRAPHSAHT